MTNIIFIHPSLNVATTDVLYYYLVNGRKIQMMLKSHYIRHTMTVIRIIIMYPVSVIELKFAIR